MDERGNERLAVPSVEAIANIFSLSVRRHVEEIRNELNLRLERLERLVAATSMSWVFFFLSLLLPVALVLPVCSFAAHRCAHSPTRHSSSP